MVSVNLLGKLIALQLFGYTDIAFVVGKKF